MKIFSPILIVLFSFYSCNYKQDLLKMQYSNDIKEKSINEFRFQLFSFINNELDTIDKSAVGLNFNRENVRFEELLDDHFSLFLIFPQKACIECFKEQIDEIKNYQGAFGDRFMVIGGFPDIRSLYLLFNEDSIISKVVNFKIRDLGFEKQIADQVFFFLTNSSGILTLVFIPIRGKPEYTRYYLELVLKRFIKTGGSL